MYPTKKCTCECLPFFFVFRFSDYHTLAHEMVKNTLNLYLYMF